MLKTFAILSSERQQAILDAAASVFAEKGYHQANVSAICRKAGISNGALYKYFKNKRDLLVDVFLSHISRLSDAFNRNYENIEKTDLSFFDALENLFGGLQDYIEREKDYIQIYNDLGSASMDEFAFELSQKIESSAYQFWVKIVERGQRNGEIRKDINSDILAYMIDNHFAMFNYSCVSAHHDKRYKVFFKHRGEKNISIEEKITLFRRLLKQLLE